jgi:cytochrome bd ubiquinol oxidase subunit I
LRPSSLFWGESLRLFTGREVYGRISTFWIKIFAIAFGMGVVTGIVTPFQFGTNWSRSSDATANVLSPLLAYEGLTAFFLEAGFLGVLLFGRERVPPWAYFVSALMVAMGHFILIFLDPGGQQLDADAGRLRDRQRPILFEGLV